MSCATPASCRTAPERLCSLKDTLCSYLFNPAPSARKTSIRTLQHSLHCICLLLEVEATKQFAMDPLGNLHRQMQVQYYPPSTVASEMVQLYPPPSQQQQPVYPPPSQLYHSPYVHRLSDTLTHQNGFSREEFSVPPGGKPHLPNQQLQNGTGNHPQPSELQLNLPGAVLGGDMEGKSLENGHRESEDTSSWGLPCVVSNDYRRFSERAHNRPDYFTEGGGLGSHNGVGPSNGYQQESPDHQTTTTGESSTSEENGNDAAAPTSVSTPTASPSPLLTVDDLKSTFPIGRMVFGKLPGYPWWPGFVVSHYFSVGPDGHISRLWLRWYGEDDMSHMAFDKIGKYEDFGDFFSPSSMEDEKYKTSLLTSLETAAHRAQLKLKSVSEDKTPNWVIPEDQSTPILVSERDSCAYFEEANIFTLQSSSKTRKRKKMSGKGGKKSGKKGCDVYLTNYEHELLEWACNGFPPCGAAGLWPSEAEQSELEQSVEAVPDGPAAASKPKDGHTTAAKKKSGTAASRKKASKSKDKGTKPLIKAHFVAVNRGEMALISICLGCGDKKVVDQHPLFEGGLCRECKRVFMLKTYQFDEDGAQMHCAICSGGEEVYMCDTEECSKVFCGQCIEKLCGAQELKEVVEAEDWTCYMCKEAPCVGMLARRPDWELKLKQLFERDRDTEYDVPALYRPIPLNQRQPLRVLGLFDGTGTGYLVLKELGLKVSKYFAGRFAPKVVTEFPPQIHHEDIVHVGNIDKITSRQVKEWGPFDLVFGGSPCNDMVYPLGNGIYESNARFFLEFFRVLDLARPKNNCRPFFWLYENVVCMQPDDKSLTSRFLNCNPVVVDAKEISPAHRARYFWGNLPGMNLDPDESKMAKRSPSGNEYMAKLFDFPTHYGQCNSSLARNPHLVNTWSIPVLRHFLFHLRNYFLCEEEGGASSTTVTMTTGGKNKSKKGKGKY